MGARAYLPAGGFLTEAQASGREGGCTTRTCVGVTIGIGAVSSCAGGAAAARVLVLGVGTKVATGSIAAVVPVLVACPPAGATWRPRHHQKPPTAARRSAKPAARPNFDDECAAAAVAAPEAVVVAVPISPWLYVCTVLAALFVSFAKRRNEISLLEGDAANHRRILQEYTPQLLDQLITIVVAATLA